MTPYIDLENGKHLKLEKIHTNINTRNELQSYNKLRNLRTSRKDDLEMLCQLLLYLCNQQNLPDLMYPKSSNLTQEQRIQFLVSYKKSYTLDKMCKFSRN